MVRFHEASKPDQEISVADRSGLITEEGVVKTLIRVLLAGLMLVSIIANGSADDFVMPEIGVSTSQLRSLFGLGDETREIGVLTVYRDSLEDQDVGRLFGRAAGNPNVFGMVFILDRENMEYRYASLISEGDSTYLKPHREQPYEVNVFEDYADEIQWITLEEEYIFFDGQLRLNESTYSDLLAFLDAVIAERDEALYRLSLEEREDGRETQEGSEEAVETEVTVSDEGVTGYEDEINLLEEENSELKNEVAELGDEVSWLKEENSGLRETVADLEGLVDPHLVRLRNMDREGANIFLQARLSFDDTSDASGPEAMARLVPTLVLSSDRTGNVYFLASVLGEFTTDEQWRVAPQVVFSMPRELLQFKLGAQFGTNAEESYFYRMDDYQQEDGSYFWSLIPSVALNIAGEESVVSLEGGLEISSPDVARFISASYELTPTHAPWLSFVIDELSATFVDRGAADENSSVYNASAGIDINLGVVPGRDQWFGKHILTMGIRAGYFLEVNGDNTVDDGFRLEFIPVRFTF